KGCMSDTVPVTVIARYQPFANFIKPEVCLDDSYAQFTDSSFIDDNTDSSFSYLWNFGDPNANVSNPNTSTLKNPLHKYTALGPYTAWLKITSVYGCTDSIARDFIVNGSFPEADFQVLNSSSLCSNLDVQISNKSTVAPGDITKIEIYWDYLNDPVNKTTDDFPYFDKIYNHKYPDFQQPLTRNFEIRIVAYSGASCLDVATKTVTVNASPATQFVTMPGICFDAAPRQVTQASETGGLPKAFDFFTGSAAVNSTGMFNPQVAGVGTDTLRYVFVSAAGCRDSSDQSITVWPSPQAKIGLSAPLCEKNNISFTDSSVANFSSIVTWNWNFGDGVSIVNSSAAPVTHGYTAAGAYTAELQVTTDSGCVSPVFQRILNVHYLPQVAFSMPDICLPDGNGVFTDLSSIADGTAAQFSYLWQFNDPANPAPSTQKNAIHRYSAVGPYQVKLVVTSGAGCKDSLTQVMNTVYPQPAAAFAVTPAEVCLGDPFQFTDQSNGNGGAVTEWNWNYDDGSVNGLTQNPVKVYQDAGNYRVSLVIHNDKGCISDTAEADLVVHPYPKVDAGPDVFVLEDGFTRLQPLVSGSQLSYNWSPALFLDSPGVRAPVFTPGQDQLYTITVTGAGGCATSDQVFVKVLKTPVIPNVFSPNGDGINDVWNIRYLESYPGCTVEIFDRYGRRVFSTTGYDKPWNGTLNGSDLPIGVYYYLIQPKNGRKPMTGSVTILR
ncbi:MAG TPA: PKD domain-containing protein, partial [Chitinophagaceae bacterium]